MDFKVIWSDAAIADLRDICSHIARHNPQAAYRMGRGILDHVRILASFPLIGPTYPRGARGTLREIVFGLTASFTMFLKRHAVSRFFTSGTVRASNPSFESSSKTA